MKKWHLALLISTVIIADQALKFYIKLNYHLNDSTTVFGKWFHLYFVENPGMAYGLKFGGDLGKLFLTVFRMGAVVFGTWYLGRIIRYKYSKGFIICAGLIYAGAIGNLLDSCFYGLIFNKGMIYDPTLREYIGYNGLASFAGKGYASFLHGNVVDMLYFPLIKGHFPAWVPGWGGDDFEFFRPIFNIADASITLGVITILLFQKSFLKNKKHVVSGQQQPVNIQPDDISQIS